MRVQHMILLACIALNGAGCAEGDLSGYSLQEIHPQLSMAQYSASEIVITLFVKNSENYPICVLHVAPGVNFAEPALRGRSADPGFEIVQLESNRRVNFLELTAVAPGADLSEREILRPIPLGDIKFTDFGMGADYAEKMSRDFAAMMRTGVFDISAGVSISPCPDLNLEMRKTQNLPVDSIERIHFTSLGAASLQGIMLDIKK